MLSSSQKAKNNLTQTANSYKIASLRSKLKESSQLTEQLDSIVQSYNQSIDANASTITSLESSIKNIFTNLKQAHSNPVEWLATVQSGKTIEKSTVFLLQSKMHQFNEIYHSVAANSILVDALTLIKANKQVQGGLKDLPIANSKREILAFYNEVSQYYRWKDNMAKGKSKYLGNIEEILKIYPELSLCQNFKLQMEETIKRDEILSKINLRFAEIQEKLLGFSLQGSKVLNFQEIQAKLQKLLVYVKQCFQFKENHKITPKNVKEHNEIIHIISLLCNSNVGLLQETIDRQSNHQIKSICGKLLQNILKNNRITDVLYDFLIENVNEQSAFKFSKSVKQLPLERKLVQCERLIRQVKQNPNFMKQYQPVSKSKPIQQLKSKQQSIIQQLNNKIHESDKQILLAEQQIYILQTQNKSLQRQKQQLTREIQKMQQSLKELESQKQQILGKLSTIQSKYQAIVMKNKAIVCELQGMKLNHHLISTKLLAKQDQFLKIAQTMIGLTNTLNDITSQKQEILTKIRQKAQKCKLQLKIYDIRIDPYLQIKNMQQVINFIEDIPLNTSNEHIQKAPLTPSHHTSHHRRQNNIIKHSRSLSNVDFLSQLMPDIIEKELQCDNLSGTLDSEELRKGIQLRQKTIKKYEVYMQKQRKEAKKHRSQILDLQGKIRALELEQIRLKQMIEDQSSEKYLQFDEQGCDSMINIEDGPQKTEIKSIQKIAEKEVELKVKQEELNFKIEEIIKHVLKLNTFKVSPQSMAENQGDFIVQEFIQETQINPQSKNIEQNE